MLFDTQYLLKIMKIFNLTILFLLITSLFACSKKPIVIEDFENNSFYNWVVEGKAFGENPAKGPVVGQQEISGFEGAYFANSFHGGDGEIGKLISSEFTIERDYINFLIGGGMKDSTYIELLVEGESVYVSHSVVESETLHWMTWDVKDYLKKKAVICIVDNQKGGWGHILVDQIEMSNQLKSNVLTNYKLSFNVTQKYLLLPIENTGMESKIQIFVDGKQQSHYLRIRIAQNKIDCWIPILIEQFKGKELTMLFQHVNKLDIGYSQIKQSSKFDFNYNETYRPVYHFTSPYGWINDPNGMIYYNGEYHLYYQYNPYGMIWGNMSWGHAVSKDLVNWKHLPVAISPDELGTIFSGSTVIDKENRTGFGKDALIAIYTSDGDYQVQSIAYSLDNGRTFTKYTNNPVLTNADIIDFRDPKVFWHAENKQWVMSLATSQTITFYGSRDLKQWEKLSEFGEGIGSHGGVWECPDLFPLKTPDRKIKWVLLVSLNPGGPNGGSATQYFIGDFDGKEFTADKLPYPLWIDYGRDNYAGVTWNNTPDGRRLFIGWMSNWDYANNVPTVNFRNAMTLPRVLSLKNNGNHLILASNPVKEMENLRGTVVTFPVQQIKRDNVSIENLLDENTGAFEIEMTIVPNGATVFGFGFTNSKGDCLNFTFDHELDKLILDRRETGKNTFSDKFASIVEAPLAEKEEYNVRLFFDKASVELFLNNGELSMTNLIFLHEAFNHMTFFSLGTNWTVKDIRVTPIIY